MLRNRSMLLGVLLTLLCVSAGLAQTIEDVLSPVPVEELLKMRLTEKEFNAPATELKPAEAEVPDAVPAEEAPQKVIFVEVQMIQVPNAKVPALVRELQNPQKRAAALKGLDEMVLQGTAKIVGWPMITGISAQRAVVESINEFRYAVAFGPGGVQVGRAFRNPVQAVPNQLGGEEFTPVPTEFDTRYVGITLEAEPRVEPGSDVISLNVVPQHTRLKAMQKVKIERLEKKETVVVEQPEIESMRVTTHVRLKSGERMLLAMFPMSEPPGHTELFILGAEIMPEETTPVVPAGKPSPEGSVSQ
jgi:hypothetical protein